jgi:hypothetical protein
MPLQSTRISHLTFGIVSFFFTAKMVKQLILAISLSFFRVVLSNRFEMVAGKRAVGGGGGQVTVVLLWRACYQSRGGVHKDAHLVCHPLSLSYTSFDR